MSTAVRLYLRIRSPDGSRLYADSVLAGNGRLRPLLAMVDGQARQCLDGVYYLRYSQDGKRVFQNVGAEPQLAQLAREKRQRLVAAKAAGVEVVDSKAKPRTLLAAAIDDYLEDTGFTKAPRTAIAYSKTLRGFAASSAKKYLEDLDRRDVLGYMAYLRRRENVPRTVYNRLIFLRTFCLAHGLKLPLEKGVASDA